MPIAIVHGHLIRANIRRFGRKGDVKAVVKGLIIFFGLRDHRLQFRTIYLEALNGHDNGGIYLPVRGARHLDLAGEQRVLELVHGDRALLHTDRGDTQEVVTASLIDRRVFQDREKLIGRLHTEVSGVIVADCGEHVIALAHAPDAVTAVIEYGDQIGARVHLFAHFDLFGLEVAICVHAISTIG